MSTMASVSWVPTASWARYWPCHSLLAVSAVPQGGARLYVPRPHGKRGQWLAGPADSGQPGSKHLGASLHHSIHAESIANPTDGLAVLARHQLADRNSCLARLLVCMHRTVHSCTGMRSLAC